MHYLYLHFIVIILEKSKFLFLLVNNSSLSPDETRVLELLQNEFPYSQAIHSLVARGYQLNDLPEKQLKLSKAAVYATNRTILKTIVTAPAVERDPSALITVEKAEEVAKARKASIVVDSNKPKEKTEEKVISKKPIEEPRLIQAIITKEVFTPSNLSGDELLNELFKDLDKLKKLKHGFEVASANFDGLPLPEQPIMEKKEEPKTDKKPKTADKSIIAEIKSTKKKIKPSDPKQKEQLDIIDKFIKSKPSIGKGKAGITGTAATDLSEGSSVFTDNIVSETLVEILIKQGKKEKAVEVLRKLIWKFPQKKAYFAAQIEELTN